MNTEMYTVTQTITPAMAEAMLEGNVSNRKLSKHAVKNLAKAIKNGNWVVSHQGVAITKDARLLDGQHRLSAIVESGIPCNMRVTYNCPEDSFTVLDIGRGRTVSDITKINRRTLEGITPLIGIGFHGKVHKSEFKDYIPVFQNESEKLIEYCGSSSKGVSVGFVKSAFILKMAENKKNTLNGIVCKDKIKQAAYKQAYKALVNGDVVNMPRSVVIVWKQLITKKMTNTERLVKTYIALSDFDKKYLGINSYDKILFNIRQSIKKLTEEHNKRINANKIRSML